MEEAVPKPIFESKTNNRLRIFFAGHQPKRYAKDWPSAQQDITNITGENYKNAMLTVLASTDKDPGYGTLRILTPQSAVHADGAIYHSDEPAAFMFQTADCPFLIVQDDVTGKVAMGHCGKYAMKACVTGHPCGDMVSTILSHFRDTDRVNLSAYITAGICGQCYKHEQDVSQVESFYGAIDHGEDRSQGELNLIRRIKHGLRHEGVLEVNIEIDGRCTRDTPELSSYRRGDPHRSSIVVLVN